MFEIEQAVVGGFVGDVRKDAIRAFGYRALFAYAVAGCSMHAQYLTYNSKLRLKTSKANTWFLL